MKSKLEREKSSSVYQQATFLPLTKHPRQHQRKCTSNYPIDTEKDQIKMTTEMVKYKTQ